MTILEEYKNQNNWRNWTSYIDRLPIKNNDIILDLGCGVGYVTKLFSKKVLKVTGIDGNAHLLNEASLINNSDNIEYINHDLKTISEISLPLADGIWASFIAAYFPDFSSILKNWLQLLKPGGWIAIVEINDLFAHQPISTSTYKGFKEFYRQQRSKKLYDYEMGSKIKDYLLGEDLEILNNECMCDVELAFNGPADRQILQALENRLNRLTALQEFFGKEKYLNVKAEFLNCLANQNHYSTSEVNYIIAKK
ncbi:MAG: class I SAM-dependent methyltransferase [Ginsengibacter sp.]